MAPIILKWILFGSQTLFPYYFITVLDVLYWFLNQDWLLFPCITCGRFMKVFHRLIKYQFYENNLNLLLGKIKEQWLENDEGIYALLFNNNDQKQKKAFRFYYSIRKLHFGPLNLKLLHICSVLIQHSMSTS